MTFPYLGNFTEIIPYNDILEFCTTTNWISASSAETELKKPERPIEERSQRDYYNSYNSSRFEISVADKNFFSPAWFNTIGATAKDYQAKIYKTMPGNAEPPHIDFFPSFLGHNDENGDPYTQEQISKLGKNIIRAWIPLQNSKLGHLLFTTNYALSSWQVGDVYELPSGLVHGFVNAGREERLVLVFTGWRA